MSKRAVVLLSGGLDSAVSAWIAKESHEHDVFALTFLYGQTHSREIESAKSLAKYLGVKEHIVLDIPLSKVSKSSLLGQGDIPSGEEGGIPSTWVPQRNSIFLSFAFGYAEVIDACCVYIGANSIDYSGYPDCRPLFLTSINEALNLASKRFVESGYEVGLQAPLLSLTKAQIVDWGTRIGVPFELTWSCYRGGKEACGTCPSCRIRLEGFRKAGLKDPIRYLPVEVGRM